MSQSDAKICNIKPLDNTFKLTDSLRQSLHFPFQDPHTFPFHEYRKPIPKKPTPIQCSFTATRQQNLMAMQPAVRYTEGADAPVQGASVFTLQIRSENHPAVQYRGVACRQSLQRSVSAWKASGRAPVFPFLQR